jgi:PBP1b-binding outer membrane lipoprotein LpoB
MDKLKMISLVAAIPLLAFMLSGCGLQKNTKPENNNPGHAAAGPMISPDVPEPRKPEQQTPDQTVSDASRQSANLDPFPENDIRAIDSELEKIDKDLETAGDFMSPDELSDAQLGI